MPHWRFAAALAMSAALVPRVASATGGVFAVPGAGDGSPLQAATVVMVRLPESIELHVRLELSAASGTLGWILPVRATPDFGLGSEAMFANLELATTPRFSWTLHADSCPHSDVDATDVFEPAPPDGPQPIVAKPLGWHTPRHLASADEATAWLADRGLEIPFDIQDALAQYEADGWRFFAVQIAGTGVPASVFPIVLHIPTSDATLPTALARPLAFEPWTLRVYVIDDARALPDGFRESVVNEAAIDWLRLGTNRPDLVLDAIAVPGADDRAFVTDSAGPTSLVPSEGIVDPHWEPDVFLGLDETQVVEELLAQRLFACTPDASPACKPLHPAAEALLLTAFLPPGVESIDPVYLDPQTQLAVIDWDPVAFVAAYRQFIVEPAELARTRIEQGRRFTRMTTTVSPGTSGPDPAFLAAAEPADVAAHQIASYRALCGGDAVLSLPGGRDVLVPGAGPWPTFDGEMPVVERVVVHDSPDSHTVLVDESDDIAEILRTHNAAHGWPAQGCSAAGDARPVGVCLVLLVSVARRRRRTPA